ncbi:MAG: Methionine biosynthesis protein MetW [Syntrophus sp. PtaU1.Bin005]|jgi:methionine biosynthesis protein MetW|uniref:methionine biosynthesis protein MetW n=1 Tax=Syntrophus buswellii TaxID=43774 RepID=UPI0009C60BF3|nr:MAG: Methionine biosynthesis protein MetW [Syntrophus sp. PtaU1.Bin005]
MTTHTEQTNLVPPDYRIISELIDSGARILDSGCGSGDLMAFLVRSRHTRGQGIELNELAVRECVEKGLNVCHGDIESGLLEYPAGSFDYVILNQSLQEIRQADALPADALRVGRGGDRRLSQFRLDRLARPPFLSGKVTDHRRPALPLVRFAQREVSQH